MLLGAWELSDEALHSVKAVLNNVIKGWVQPQLWAIMVCLLLALPGQAFEAEELSVCEWQHLSESHHHRSLLISAKLCSSTLDDRERGLKCENSF